MLIGKKLTFTAKSICCAVWILFAFSTLVYYSRKANNTLLVQYLDSQFGKHVLLVLAHPDDESVFFTPIITFLHERGHVVSLLTLTAGEYCNGKRDLQLGLQRINELRNSCLALGIPESNLYLGKNAIPYNSFPQSEKSISLMFADGKSEVWSRLVVENTIKNVYDKNPFQTILSFDENGISWHPNHKAASAAARNFVRRHNVKLFTKHLNFPFTTCVPHLEYISHLALITESIPTRIFGFFGAFSICAFQGAISDHPLHQYTNTSLQLYNEHFDSLFKNYQTAFSNTSTQQRNDYFSILHTQTPSEKEVSLPFLTPKKIRVCNPSLTKVKNAVFCHKSQLRFHRVWNTFTSSYSYTNELVRTY